MFSFDSPEITRKPKVNQSQLTGFYMFWVSVINRLTQNPNSKTVSLNTRSPRNAGIQVDMEQEIALGIVRKFRFQ